MPESQGAASGASCPIVLGRRTQAGQAAARALMELGLPRLHRPREQEDEREDGRGWGHLTRPEGQITGVVGVHGG